MDPVSDSCGSRAAKWGHFGQANYASAKARVQAMLGVLSREAAVKMSVPTLMLPVCAGEIVKLKITTLNFWRCQWMENSAIDGESLPADAAAPFA